MTIEQIIGKYDEAIMEAHADLMRNELNVAQIKALHESLELFTAGRDALREKKEHENPQALTVEELREMDREPVWVQRSKWSTYASGWTILDGDNEILYADIVKGTAIAYRYPPKENNNDSRSM